MTKHSAGTCALLFRRPLMVNFSSLSHEFKVVMFSQFTSLVYDIPRATAIAHRFQVLVLSHRTCIIVGPQQSYLRGAPPNRSLDFMTRAGLFR